MQSGDKTSITCTVIACSNASRSVISPWVVLDRKFLKPKYTYGEVHVTTYELSGSGWITVRIFNALKCWLIQQKHSVHVDCPKRVELISAFVWSLNWKQTEGKV